MKHYLLFAVVLLLTSCANYKLHHNAASKNWENLYNSNYPSQTPDYVLYGIGDAGYLPNGNTSPALVGMQKMMLTESAPTSAVFLGDNIYPKGMPKKKAGDRKEAEEAIIAQMDIVKNFGGHVVFLPGNHDWRQQDAQKGIERQEDFIQDYMSKKVFSPNNGCSGPTDFKLSDDVVLIVFDSEWYLQNWDNQIDFNEKCDYKTRFDFIYELTDVIKKYAKDKRVVVAMHHPIFTYGVHGGKFSARDNIFPFAALNESLKIPLPILGFLYPILRKNVGQRQDINGEKYKELRQKLLTATDAFDNVIFISGHEHNMQYINKEEHHHIIAGSGSKTTAVSLGEGAEFSYAAYGFTRLSFFNKGETWIEFFACQNGESKRVFSRKLTPELTTFEAKELKFEPPTKPYVEIPIVEKSTAKGGLFNFFMGKQYSELYNMPLRARVTNLSIREGGLRAVKRGGGFQTNSLRLTNSNDKDFVMRAVKKDPSRLLPDEFLGTVAIEAVDHFLTTAHPLSAYTIPPMAQSIGILHTKPELVYIPKQAALGEFNEDHGDQLYLFEDRPDGDRSDRDNFGNSKNMINTPDLVEEMKKSGHNRPMQSDVVRNRLFDMIIGDWDRHDDQWRWGEFKGADKKSKIYRPVPRDRDQAYAIFEGPLVAFGRLLSPGIAKFQTFDEKIKNVEYFNFNARYFDRSFTNEMTWLDWQKEIQHIQTTLTDVIIHEGVSKMQDDFYAIHGKSIESKIKSRRDKLEIFARKYYKSLAKHVDVHATYDDDLIEIIRSHGQLTLRISDLDKKGQLNYTYYERTFIDNETKSVNVYGLDGDDIFKSSGAGSNIKVRWLGGTDDDTYSNDGKGKRIHVYDYADNSHTASKSGLALHLSNDYSDNAYDRKAFKYNHSFVLPLIGFNPDNGFLLGGMFSGVWHGFKKDPYKMSHSLSGLYSFETEGFKFGYEGRFIEAVGSWNILLSGLYQDNLFSNNFFGIGNNTINHEDEFDFELDYNRVRNSIINVDLFLQKELANNAHFHVGPKLDVREVERTANRFITTFADINDPVFDKISYVGAEMGFTFRNVDNEANPHQGVDFGLAVDYMTDLDDYNITKTSLETGLGIYFPLDNKENFIWAHRIHAGFTFSEEALFYHQQQIGGNKALRGFRNERFTGESALAYNTDLRVKLFSFNSYFAPSSVGIVGSFDIGRVFQDNDSSIDDDTWHTNFGGGLYITPFDLAVIKVSYFASGEEDPRILFGLGFDF